MPFEGQVGRMFVVPILRNRLQILCHGAGTVCVPRWAVRSIEAASAACSRMRLCVQVAAVGQLIKEGKVSGQHLPAPLPICAARLQHVSFC